MKASVTKVAGAFLCLVVFKLEPWFFRAKLFCMCSIEMKQDIIEDMIV